MNRSRQLFVSWCLIFGFVLAIVGCASIVSGTRQNIVINSVPSGAQVKIVRFGATQAKVVDWEGMTPSIVPLKRKYDYLVNVSVQGYKTAEVILESGSNGWVWGNLVFGGIIGLIVDFSNGAAKKLKPNEISVTLAKITDTMGEENVYMVLQGRDDQGKLHVLSVQLIPHAVQ